MNDHIQAISSCGLAKYAASSTDKKQKALLAAAGLAIGFINGIFGAGGGMLAVPALGFIAKLDDKSAHATAIAVILPLCLISSIIYSLRGSFDMFVVLPTSAGVLIGGVIGAILLKALPSKSLSFLFYGLMLCAGLKMIF